MCYYKISSHASLFFWTWPLEYLQYRWLAGILFPLGSAASAASFEAKFFPSSSLDNWLQSYSPSCPSPVTALDHCLRSQGRAIESSQKAHLEFT